MPGAVHRVVPPHLMARVRGWCLDFGVDDRLAPFVDP